MEVQAKCFIQGLRLLLLIDKADIDTPYDEFGPDRNQTVVFKMRENMLKLINIYPELVILLSLTINFLKLII